MVFTPFSLFEKFTSNKPKFEKLCKSLNEYSKNIFEKITEILPKDENENFLKFFCLLKKEKKFLEVNKRKMVFISNKKLIEIEDENNFENFDNLNLYPISNFEMIEVATGKNEVEISYSKTKKIEYSSLSYMSLCKLVKDLYNKDCLILLSIKKKN